MTKKKPKVEAEFFAEGIEQEDGSIEFDNGITHTTLTPLKNMKFKTEGLWDKTPPKDKKIFELLEMLNKPASKGRFWKDHKDDDSSMGDVIGIVPITRIITSTIGSHYFPYEKKEDQLIAQFIIIDICNKELTKEEKLQNKKSSTLSNYGVKHIISDDINYIYDVVQNIS